MKAKFTKGQKILVCMDGAGFVTKEPGVVKSVTKKGVLLDNGPGNDPSGPFNALTGSDQSNIAGVIPGWARWIEVA